MQTKVELITPEIARVYLAQNCGNRKVSKYMVNMYSEAMKRGEWMLNGESIKFDVDGNLIDGQHRLHALIEANISLELLVVRGLQRSAFKTLDVGKKRTAGDCLSIEGIANYNTVAAIVRMYMKMREKDGELTLFSKVGNPNCLGSLKCELTNAQVLAEYHEHSGEYDEITRFTFKLYNDMRLLPTSLLGAYISFLIIYMGKEKQKVFDFFSQCIVGEKIGSSSISFLHKLLVKRSNKTVIVNYTDLDKYIKKVWNLFITGKDVKVVYIKKDEKYKFL